MSVDRPLAFALALLGALVMAALLLAAERRMTQRDLVYSNLEFFTAAIAPRAWIGRLFRGLWIAALILGAFALGGVHARIPLPARDGAVFICIDTSGSMASTDIAPTRAAAAKAAAGAFIAAAPAGTKVGVIAFATGAGIVAPLSADHAAVSAALDQLPAPNGATAIGDALALAQANFPPVGHRVVILITDGVNNNGADPQTVAQDLGAHHIPVYTIGIGTPNGDIIGGEQSTIDEDALRGYAQASGGAYARAENAQALRTALERLGRETSLESQKVDLSFPCALAAAVLLAAALFSGLATGRVP